MRYFFIFINTLFSPQVNKPKAQTGLQPPSILDMLSVLGTMNTTPKKHPNTQYTAELRLLILKKASESICYGITMSASLKPEGILEPSSLTP